VAAQRPGEPAAELRLPRPAGPPARLQASAARAVVSAGDGPLAVAVTLRDAAGNPADGELEATADAGQVAPAERLEPGAYRVSWTLPAQLSGRRRAELHLRAGGAEALVLVRLRPGAPAGLELASDAAELTADGQGAVTLRAAVADAHGNPVDEPPARVTASAGEVGPPRPTGPGRFAFTYRPRPVSVRSEDEVLADLPPLSSRVRLRLRPPLGWLALGASAGLAARPGGWLGLQAGAEVSAWRWLAGQEAGLSLAAAFSRFRDDRTVLAGAGAVPFSGEVRAFTLLASAAWRRTVGRDLALRLSTGGGAARVESGVSTGGGPLLPEAGWVPALGASAALGVPAWRGRAWLELRATWLADADLPSLRGAASPLSLSLGYELDVR
jgi:hypothetical protein